MSAVINEFAVSHAGTDDHEFIEILGDPNTDYSNLWILQIEGDSSGPGTIDSAVQVGTTDADGFWTTDFSTNTYENGTMTLMLVENFTGTQGDDIDLNDDGSADSAPWTSIVDSVAVTDGGAGDRTYAATVLAADFDGGSFTVGGASRLPDGTDTDAPGDWLRNDFDLAGIDGFAGTPTDDEALNTPGAANVAVGDVPPTAPSVVSIPQIQGAGHQSAYAGQTVITTGIVTALESNGFFLQDPTGDGDIATSDAVFVFTSSAPAVAVGDLAVVTGGVSEFIPGGASTNNLSTTQIVATNVVSAASGLELPEAVILGEGGRVPPTEVVEDDAFGSFDPETDGIDYFESLEGMRVTVPDAVATSADNRFGETWAVANQGANAGAFNERDGIVLQEDDLNPERVQIQFDADTLPGFSPSVKVGDSLGDVTGVLGYDFGNYEVKVTEAFTVADGGLEEETSSLAGSENQLTVASYNILNVTAANGVDAAQIARLAEQIVANLNGPDIIALQEVQDDSGETDDGTVSADATLQAIVDAIALAGGPQYAFFDVDPNDNTQGGVPGGNIRVAYLYNPARVDLVDGSVKALDTLDGFQAGQDARVPLEAQFSFQGETVTLINNHLSSKFGSSPVYGAVQPFINAGDDQRTAQTESLNAYVDGLVANDPEAKVVVLGDMNDFQFSNPIKALKGAGEDQVLFNQIDTLGDEAYTYNFEGNSQVLDHLLVSESLKDRVEFDIVHQNVDFGDAASSDPAIHNGAASDHEPILARITFGDIQAAPVAQDDLEIERLQTYDSGLGEGSAETVAYDSASQRLFITNSDAESVDIVDISDPTQPQKVGSIDVSASGSPTQVAVKDGIVAVAIDVEDSDGLVAFYDASGNFLHSVTVGNLPDHLVFTPDGMKLLVANEGEYTGDPANNPLGTVSIIDLSGGLTQATVQTADFTAFDGMEDALREAGVRLFPGESVSEDVEPEYIAISPDGTQAFVTLQEANAVAILDIATATFLDIVPLGAKDHSLPGNLLDTSDDDGEYNLEKAPVFGLYMPDQIASFEIGGETFYITANEGDARNADERIKDLDLDPEAFPDAEYLQQDEVIGRLEASSIDGDTDGDGDIDQLFVYGARSFSIWNSSGEQVFDSGDQIARIMMDVLTEEQLEELDGRSDNKGAEPEGVTIGVVGGQTYAFVGLERANGVMVFNVSDPTDPKYVEYLQTEGDIAPEGMTFIAAEDSPNGKALLAVANEVSGTTSIYEIEPEDEAPATFKLQILHASDLEGGVEAIGRAANFAAIVDLLEDTHENSITLSAGD
ncbi:MAG: choice-of-anchor I family protein, partial [Kiloniellaceae bacterium]